MIQYNPKNWLNLIFSISHSDTLRILWKQLIYIGLLTALLVYAEQNLFHTELFEKLPTVYQLLGFVISLLLIFRTNTAYDRWWEGRKLWGSVVNDSRNFILKINAVLPKQDAEWHKSHIVHFTSAMRDHLRDIPYAALNLEQTIHAPLHIMTQIQQKLASQKKSGFISEENFLALEKHLVQLIDSLGGCERIKNTPIPYSYSMFFKKFIFLYVVTLPLAFVVQFGYYSIIISVFFFYVLVSIEVLAEEIEDPFGTDDNDLPIDDICRRIERNLDQIIAQ
ncbi:MAG: hypothetical protein FJX99_07755 [Bacteroidetes bacterium]|nr:hypothetical protein [Bacteroidota bacterium]